MSFLMTASVESSCEERIWASLCEPSGAAGAPDRWAIWNGAVNFSSGVFSNLQCSLKKW